MLNQDAIRDLLCYLGERLRADANGKKPKPIHLKRIVEKEPLDKYSAEDIYQAGEYLIKRGFALPVTPGTSARFIVFSALTGAGEQYLEAVKSTKVWDRLKKVFGNVFDTALSSLMSAALDCGIDFARRKLF